MTEGKHAATKQHPYETWEDSSPRPAARVSIPESDPPRRTAQRRKNQPNDLGMAYLLLLFGGLLGLHRHYLGRHTSGIVMTVLAITVVGLVVNAVWVVIDLFLVHAIFLEEQE